MARAASASAGATPAKSGKGKKRRKAKKAPLSAADKAFEKVKRDHRAAIRSSFTKAGFRRVTGVSDREFTYENQTTDLDDIFVYENVVILAEYTCSKAPNVGDHLKLKKNIYDKILADPEAFLSFLAVKFPASADQLASGYHVQQTIVKPTFPKWPAA